MTSSHRAMAMVTTMFTPGLVSVTFRQKSIDEILTRMRSCGLFALEIGSDVHAPKNELAECRRIAQLCAQNGIKVVSYGSYYRLGEAGNSDALFAEYLEAANTLGAANIRIWAGITGSASLSNDQRAAWTEEAFRCAEAAKKAGLTLSFEYHGGTLTDNADSALRLMQEIAHPNAYLYWQPNQYLDLESNLSALSAVLPYVKNVHVFAWDARGGECVRYPLSEHQAAWAQYLALLSSDGKPRCLLLEFVRGDSDAQFCEDAEVLKKWST